MGYEPYALVRVHFLATGPVHQYSGFVSCDQKCSPEVEPGAVAGVSVHDHFVQGNDIADSDLALSMRLLLLQVGHRGKAVLAQIHFLQLAAPLCYTGSDGRGRAAAAPAKAI